MALPNQIDPDLVLSSSATGKATDRAFVAWGILIGVINSIINYVADINVGHVQAFTYTATGSETRTDAGSFLIALPSARANTSYVATVMGNFYAAGTGTGVYVVGYDPLQNTTTHMAIVTGVAPQNGEVFTIVAQDLA